MLTCWTGRSFDVQRYSRSALRDAEAHARTARDKPRELQLHQLIITAEGHYDFAQSTDNNLNSRVNLEPERFRAYLTRAWSNTH